MTFLSPGASGWRVLKNQELIHAENLQAAVAGIPEGAHVHVALPTRLIIFERMRLPSAEPAELGDMARLQLEKLLPFPLEEVDSDLEILNRGETESDVLVMAVHQPPVTALCRPLLDQRRWPERVTAFVRHAVAVVPKEGYLLLLYREEEQVVVAICAEGKLQMVQPIDAADLEHELSSFLLNAELEGMSVNFDRLCLDKSCAALQPAVAAVVSAPVMMVSLDKVPLDVTGDLLPPSWRDDRKRSERGVRLKSYLMLAGAVWAALVVLGALWLGWLQFRTNRVSAEVAKLQPDLEFVQSRQARWLQLAPAIDSHLYTVEILRLVNDCTPSPDVKIAQFEQTPDQFSVEGTAPSAGMAVDFLQRLRDNEGLKAFSFDDMTPSLLPDDKAQFRIFGKR